VHDPAPSNQPTTDISTSPSTSYPVQPSEPARLDSPNQVDDGLSPLECLVQPAVILRDIDPTLGRQDLVPELFEGFVEGGGVTRGETDGVGGIGDEGPGYVRSCEGISAL
jgi:hypothetical protein